MGEAALGLSGLERRAVHEQLVFRDTQKKRTIGSLGKAFLQFVPSGRELALGSLVIEPVQPNILDQNVQAVHEASRGRDSATFICVCRDDTRLLEFPVTRSG